MRISVVVPTLNAERFLLSALDSIAQQDFNNYEVILVDGGSTDRTIPIAKCYPHITIIHAPPRGEPNAINIGFKHATGDILTWLDADDAYELGCFVAVSEFFAGHTDVDWVYGKCHVIDEKGNGCRQWVTSMKEAFQKRYSYAGLLLGDFIAQPATFFRRISFLGLAGLDEREKLAFDYDLWLRLGRAFGPPGYIDGYLANWRAHKDSETAKDLVHDLKDGLRLSLKYSPRQYHLRPLQYGVFCLSLLGYFASGALD